MIGETYLRNYIVYLYNVTVRHSSQPYLDKRSTDAICRGWFTCGRFPRCYFFGDLTAGSHISLGVHILVTLVVVADSLPTGEHGP